MGPERRTVGVAEGGPALPQIGLAAAARAAERVAVTVAAAAVTMCQYVDPLRLLILS